LAALPRFTTFFFFFFFSPLLLSFRVFLLAVVSAADVARLRLVGVAEAGGDMLRRRVMVVLRVFMVVVVMSWLVVVMSWCNEQGGEQ
jgi:hypothetical protein